MLPSIIFGVLKQTVAKRQFKLSLIIENRIDLLSIVNSSLGYAENLWQRSVIGKLDEEFSGSPSDFVVCIGFALYADSALFAAHSLFD